MKIIIPMAGMGTRMRPHTLCTPKPMLKIAGISIIERIVNDLIEYTGKEIDEIHFVIGNFGIEIEKKLIAIAESRRIRGYIHFQQEALGTAHAIFCAESALNSEVLISFADTIFIGNLSVENQEAIIWTKEVEHPENYGIAVCDSRGYVKSFVEKPKNLISRNAIIGIYYFRNAECLKNDIELLIKNGDSKNGEFQLTDSLSNLLKNGVLFNCKNIEHWLDCGNKGEFLNSNKFLLEKQKSVFKNFVSIKSKIVDPVFIGSNVQINGSTIGPYVSIDENSVIIDTVIKNSIVGKNSLIQESELTDSIIGNHNKLKGLKGIVNMGDYNEHEKI